MRTHQQSIHQQFDPQAQAYLTSTVHAQGPDFGKAKALIAQTIPPTGQAIDVGCGAGHLSFALAPMLTRVVAVDPSSNMLSTVAQTAATRGLTQIETLQASAESLPFADACCDLVCTRYSAHHWRQLKSALYEARRILKPHGYMLIIDVLGDEDPLVDTHLQTLEVLRDLSHVRNRTATEWRALLEQTGFSLLDHVSWPLPLVFKSWIERMSTAPERASLIRAFQDEAPREVHAALRFEADGSFTVHTGLFWARATI
jgi:ubiquinone/menaquinone biosynthesis C-methylase UbiE